MFRFVLEVYLHLHSLKQMVEDDQLLKTAEECLVLVKSPAHMATNVGNQ